MYTAALHLLRWSLRFCAMNSDSVEGLSHLFYAFFGLLLAAGLVTVVVALAKAARGVRRARHDHQLTLDPTPARDIPKDASDKSHHESGTASGHHHHHHHHHDHGHHHHPPGGHH